MESYKGAVLVSDGHWKLTNDSAELLAASDDVIWASNLDELRSELELRNPCDPARPVPPGLPRLSRVVNTHGPDKLAVYPHPVMPYGLTNDKVFDLLQAVGTVCVYDGVDHLRSDKLFDGCTFRCPHGGLPTISYDPKTAAKIARKRTLIKDNRHVSVTHIAVVLHHLERVTIPPFPHSGTYGDSSRNTYVNYLAARLVLFNLLYGKSAHRRFKHWQEFVLEWQERLASTDEVFRKHGQAMFADFMIREIKARKRPALPESTFDMKNRPQEIKLP